MFEDGEIEDGEFEDGDHFDDEAVYSCAFCGEANGIDVDVSAGRMQRYVEDCQVCCRPNGLTVRFDDELRAAVEAVPES